MIDLIEQLKIDEGFRSKPYKCSAGKLTIGYGRNIEDNGITKEEAEILLYNDVGLVTNELSGTFSWFYGLSKIRKSVLINMAFNLGMPRLKAFKRMIAALGVNDYEEAARQMLDSKWANQVGDRATRLANQMIDG